MSYTRLLVFIAITSSILFGVHYFLWARLVRDVGMPQPWRTVATILLGVLAVAMPVALATSRAATPGPMRALYFVGYGWMGFMFLLFVGLLAGDVGRLVWSLASRIQGAPLDDERRMTLARIVGGAVALVGLGAGATGIVAALRPVVARVRVPLAKLPQGMSGLRIVQLTDVHVGPTIGKDFLERVVATANGLDPDITVITGDLVDGSVNHLREQIAPLAGLRAKHGVFFVTGNHEYYSGVVEWVEHLTSMGIRVLRNERVAIEGEGGGFDLAGVDDFRARGLAPGHGHDLAAALNGRDPSRELVLLAHQPKSVIEAAAAGVGLQLSGHTHGGQIFPWRFLVRLDQPFVDGLHKLKDTWLYVSRGTGYWGPPMRVAAPAEVTEITLVRA